MKLHVMVALAATGFVTGCGFIPKKPPLPDNSRRVPVNLAAPVTRAWPPPSAQQAMPYAAPLPISAPLPAAVTSSEPNPEPVEAKIKPTAPLAPASKVALLDPPRTPDVHSDAVWPITQKFNATDSLDATPKLAIDRVSFQWPAAHAPAPVAQAVVPTHATAEPIPIDLGSIKPVKAIDMTAMLKQELPSSSSDDAATAVALTTFAAPQPSAANEKAPTEQPEPQPLPTTEGEPNPIPVLAQAVWSAEKGITVSEMLREWATKEDWAVRWDTNTDFRIEAQFSIEAPTFVAAANQIFKAYRNAGYAFTVTAYRNQVLVVTDPRK